MKPPVHGGQLRQLALSYGLDPAAILDFSANINPEGPAPEVLAAIRESIRNPDTLACYPDLDLTDLRTAIVEHLDEAQAIAHGAGLTPDHVAVANGFVPLLEAAVRGLGLKRTLLPVPAFSEYRGTLERCHAMVTAHPLDRETFRYDIQRIVRDLDVSAADSLLMANPQNPSGVLTPAQTILDLALSRPEVTMLLDEAFIDYVPQESVVQRLRACPNLLVFRSVTKFFAIPGLRVAYAVGNPEKMSRLRRELAPWPVSTLASVAMIAALRGRSAQKTIELNGSRRTQLLLQLEALGITCPEAAANFLLLRLPRAVPDLWERLLREHQILLRRCDNFESLGADVFRSAVRCEADNSRLVTALGDCLRSS